MLSINFKQTIFPCCQAARDRFPHLSRGPLPSLPPAALPRLLFNWQLRQKRCSGGERVGTDWRVNVCVQVNIKTLFVLGKHGKKGNCSVPGGQLGVYCSWRRFTYIMHKVWDWLLGGEKKNWGCDLEMTRSFTAASSPAYWRFIPANSESSFLQIALCQILPQGRELINKARFSGLVFIGAHQVHVLSLQ